MAFFTSSLVGRRSLAVKRTLSVWSSYVPLCGSACLYIPAAASVIHIYIYWLPTKAEYVLLWYIFIYFLVGRPREELCALRGHKAILPIKHTAGVCFHPLSGFGDTMDIYFICRTKDKPKRNSIIPGLQSFFGFITHNSNPISQLCSACYIFESLLLSYNLWQICLHFARENGRYEHRFRKTTPCSVFPVCPVTYWALAVQSGTLNSYEIFFPHKHYFALEWVRGEYSWAVSQNGCLRKVTGFLNHQGTLQMSQAHMHTWFSLVFIWQFFLSQIMSLLDFSFSFFAHGDLRLIWYRRNVNWDSDIR